MKANLRFILSIAGILCTVAALLGGISVLWKSDNEKSVISPLFEVSALPDNTKLDYGVWEWRAKSQNIQSAIDENIISIYYDTDLLYEKLQSGFQMMLPGFQTEWNGVFDRFTVYYGYSFLTNWPCVAPNGDPYTLDLVCFPDCTVIAYRALPLNNQAKATQEDEADLRKYYKELQSDIDIDDSYRYLSQASAFYTDTPSNPLLSNFLQLFRMTEQEQIYPLYENFLYYTFHEDAEIRTFAHLGQVYLDVYTPDQPRFVYLYDPALNMITGVTYSIFLNH